MMTKRHDKQPISGILLLNKPQGITSNHALQKVKHLYQAQKAGHTGSLDPMATGMLPICFGEASKFSGYLLDADKIYLATAKVGEAMDTGDATGKIIATNEHVNLDAKALELACEQMIGTSEQVPPMYSALKFKGQPLYKLARQGVSVERKPRKIRINQIKITEVQSETFSFSVRCSKGTYIRTLIEDIAAKLGYYAHMTELHRIATAGFESMPMYELSQLTEMTDSERQVCLLPIDKAVSHLSSILVDKSELVRLQKGQQIEHALANANCIYRLICDEQFYGLVIGISTGLLAAHRLLAYRF
ncbi:tRNA pseudouridine(55) synthase TruB [Legionella sp. W05-934-2]|uniref:tRNA pseudouridine(55) synthase TruB n=1 Tax=Legionella sp. W05-934-2 TaxID=1198649 RepID=UPI003462AFC0